jgi:hypothetical protein
MERDRHVNIRARLNAVTPGRVSILAATIMLFVFFEYSIRPILEFDSSAAQGQAVSTAASSFTPDELQRLGGDSPDQVVAVVSSFLRSYSFPAGPLATAHVLVKLSILSTNWPAPGSEDTELGVFMGPEVDHGETEVYTGVQA